MEKQETIDEPMVTTRQSTSLLAIAAAVFVAAGLFSCSQSTDASGADFYGGLSIRLVDAPGTFDQVNLVIRRIEIHRAGSGPDIGWRVVTDDVNTYDIIHLTNGRSDTIALKQVPVGDYDQIKVLFGISNVVVNGMTQTVDLPLSIANGFIIQHPFHIDESYLFQLVFDIDAGRTVRPPATGTHFVLSPVIRVQDAIVSGSISGSVLGPDSLARPARVETVIGTDTAATLNDVNASGSFQLVAIPEGTYAVHIVPADSTTALDTVIASVPVIRQKDWSLGRIFLRKR